jgi:hypothetical protein
VCFARAFLEELFAGKMTNGLFIVERLERHAMFDPRVMKAISGYEPRILDITWTFRREPSEPEPPWEIRRG